MKNWNAKLVIFPNTHNYNYFIGVILNMCKKSAGCRGGDSRLIGMFYNDICVIYHVMWGDYFLASIFSMASLSITVGDLGG